jgi:hypothetical protein
MVGPPHRDLHTASSPKAERLQVENAEPHRAELTILEWAFVLLVTFGVVFLMVFPFVLGDRFAKVFAELGGALPSASRLVLTRWFPPGLALVPAAMLVVGVASRPSAGVRRGLIAGAFVAVLVSTSFCLYGLYAPIFALAGAIKAD